MASIPSGMEEVSTEKALGVSVGVYLSHSREARESILLCPFNSEGETEGVVFISAAGPKETAQLIEHIHKFYTEETHFELDEPPTGETEEVHVPLTTGALADFVTYLEGKLEDAGLSAGLIRPYLHKFLEDKKVAKDFSNARTWDAELRDAWSDLEEAEALELVDDEIEWEKGSGIGKKLHITL